MYYEHVMGITKGNYYEMQDNTRKQQRLTKKNLCTKFILGAEPTNTTRRKKIHVPRENKHTSNK